MRLIGVTGGVGAGKSRVLNYIKDNYNCEIVLADDVANDIKEPGEQCYEAIVELLGRDITGEDGRIDKQLMAARMFADDTLLAKVNGIIHPATIERIKELGDRARAEDKLDYFIIEAALLIENGFGSYVDEMWYIYTDEPVRRMRLKESRGYSDDKIDDIMSKQLSDEEFRAGCDVVINNSGDFEVTKREIDAALTAK